VPHVSVSFTTDGLLMIAASEKIMMHLDKYSVNVRGTVGILYTCKEFLINMKNSHGDRAVGGVS
jgi:hypothetical protein